MILTSSSGRKQRCGRDSRSGHATLSWLHSMTSMPSQGASSPLKRASCWEGRAPAHRPALLEYLCCSILMTSSSTEPKTYPLYLLPLVHRGPQSRTRQDASYPPSRRCTLQIRNSRYGAHLLHFLVKSSKQLKCSRTHTVQRRNSVCVQKPQPVQTDLPLELLSEQGMDKDLVAATRQAFRRSTGLRGTASGKGRIQGFSAELRAGPQPSE